MKLISVGAAVALIVATAASALAQDNPTSGVHGAIYGPSPVWPGVDRPVDRRAMPLIGEPRRMRPKRRRRRG